MMAKMRGIDENEDDVESKFETIKIFKKFLVHNNLNVVLNRMN